MLRVEQTVGLLRRVLASDMRWRPICHRILPTRSNAEQGIMNLALTQESFVLRRCCSIARSAQRAAPFFSITKDHVGEFEAL